MPAFFISRRFVRRASSEESPAPTPGTLADALTDWNAAQSATKVVVSGTETWSNTSAASGNKDYIDPNPSHGIRQHGTITRIRFDVGGAVHVAGWKFKVWRKSGTTYTVVGESETFETSSFGAQNYDLVTPITGCQPGDMCGVYVPSGAVYNTEYPSTGYELIIANGDNSSLNNPTPSSDWSPRLEAYGPAPFAGFVGDSIMAGHHETFYRPFLDSGISGDPDGEPAHHIWDDFSDLIYQNFSKGSQTWAFGAANVAKVAAVTPSAVVCMFGVNDVAGSRSWEDIESDMDTFLAGLPGGTNLFICEVLPYTSGSDAEAAAIRSLNANYASWCTSNGATLISCHDAMGQTRVATGELDDLKTAYDYDGVHLTDAGVLVLSGLIADALDSYTW